jgi:hypothetical protein
MDINFFTADELAIASVTKNEHATMDAIRRRLAHIVEETKCSDTFEVVAEDAIAALTAVMKYF